MSLVVVLDNEHSPDSNMNSVLCLLLMPWQLQSQNVYPNIGSSTVSCSNSVGCVLQCSGNNACASGTFECIDTPSCNVECSGRLGCSGLSISVISNETATVSNIQCSGTGNNLCDSLSVSLFSPVQPSNLSFVCDFTGNGEGCSDLTMDCNTNHGECNAECSPNTECQVESHSVTSHILHCDDGSIERFSFHFFIR